MRTENDTVAVASEVPPSTIKVVIIYEDFVAGARAKDFAERLAQALSCAADPALSIWRSELLDCAPIGGQAAREVADCDYLIVSLRGDHAFSYGTRHWIEMQLGGVSARGTSLILLAGANLSSDGRAHQYARYFFRSVCAENGAPFFTTRRRLHRTKTRRIVRSETWLEIDLLLTGLEMPTVNSIRGPRIQRNSEAIPRMTDDRCTGLAAGWVSSGIKAAW